MTREDFLFYVAVIGGPATVISCLYQIAAYHWPRNAEAALRSEDGSNTKPIWVNAVLALIVCAAVGLDYSDRRNLPPTVTVTNWGVSQPPGGTAPFYTVIMNATGIQRFKENYKVILVARNASWPNVDPANDTAVEKSTAYTITGPIMQIGFQGLGKIRWAAGQDNQAELTVVLLPDDVSPDEFTRMSDAKRLNAKIVGGAGQVVVGATSANSPSPSAAPIPAK